MNDKFDSSLRCRKVKSALLCEASHKSSYRSSATLFQRRHPCPIRTTFPGKEETASSLRAIATHQDPRQVSMRRAPTTRMERDSSVCVVLRGMPFPSCYNGMSSGHTRLHPSDITKTSTSTYDSSLNIAIYMCSPCTSVYNPAAGVNTANGALSTAGVTGKDSKPS